MSPQHLCWHNLIELLFSTAKGVYRAVQTQLRTDTHPPPPASPMKYLHVWSTSNYKTAVKVLSCFFCFLVCVFLMSHWKRSGEKIKCHHFKFFLSGHLPSFFFPFFCSLDTSQLLLKKTWVLRIAFPMIHLPSPPSLPSILLMEGGWDPA